MSTGTAHRTIAMILQDAQALTGLSVWDVAQQYQMPLPASMTHAKGWMGLLMERALGASAGSLAIPDFPDCGLELKTIPLNIQGQPQETTYVTTCPAAMEQNFEQSVVAHKLQQVLWIPLWDTGMGPLMRRVGEPYLSDLSGLLGQQIQSDWEQIAELVMQGQWDRLTSRLGVYLHVRPKAPDGRAQWKVHDESGHKTWTLRRGFYLRRACTHAWSLKG